MTFKQVPPKIIFRGIIVFALFLISSFQNVSAQNCSVNAGVPETICENASYMLSGSATGLIAGGPTWSQVGGPSVIILAPTNLNTGVSGLTGGNTYTFRLSATCTDNSVQFQDVAITVLPITVASAGPDLSSCPDATGSLIVNGNAPNNPGETGSWSIVGDNDAGVTINFPNAASTTLTTAATSAGASTLRWTITGPTTGGISCESFDEITVTNFGGQQPVNAGPDQALDNCYTVSQTTQLNGSFGGNNLNGQQGTWSFVTGPNTPNIGQPNNNTTNVSGLIEGTYTFRWSVVGPCATGQDTVTITVDEATQDVTQATIVNDNIAFCDTSITSATLRANAPEFSGETVLWEQISGPTAGVSITNPTSNSTSVTGLSSPNTYGFRYTITNATTNCVSSDSGTILFNPNNISILANGGADIIAECNLTSVNIPFTTSGGGTNEYRIVNGPSDSSLSYPTSFQNFNNSSPLNIVFDEEGTYTVEMVRRQTGQILTGCQQASDAINITVSRIPTASNAGTGQNLACGVTSSSLAGNTVAVGRSLWSQISGPNTATIETPFNRITDISGLTEGTYIFRYIISGESNCPPAESDVQVFVSSSTNGPSDAGTDQTVCFGTPVQLAGSVAPDGQEGTWAQASGPNTITFSDSNDPEAVASGFTTASSAYVLTWTIDNPTVSCGPPSVDTVTITTNTTQGPSTANAGTDQCLPSGTTNLNLSGNAPAAGEQGLWSVVPNNGGLTFTDDTLFNTTATIATEDSYIVTWTVSSNAPGCQSTSDDVEISIGGAATANAGVDQADCSSTFTMAATSSTNDGLWTQISGPGGFNINDNTSPTAIFTFLNSGIYVFEWTVMNGSCSTASDQIELRVGIPPTTAVTGGAQTICNASDVVLSGNTFDVNTENGVWTLLSGAPNTPNIIDATDPNTVVNGLITGSYTFRWSISGDPSCPSSFADVVIDVFAPANAGVDQALCNATNVLLEATRGSTGTWTQISGPIVTITQDPSDGHTANAQIVPGNTYVFQFETNYAVGSGCANLSDQVTVVNSGPPSINPDAGSDQLLCQADLAPTNTTTLMGNAAPADVDTATWRFASQPSGSVATIDNPNNNVTTLSNLSVPGIYILEWNFASGNCTDVADVVRIEIFEAPSTAQAGADQPNACQLNAQLNAVPPMAGIGIWSFANASDDPSNGAVIIDSPNSPITTLSNITTLGAYTLTWTVTNGNFVSPSSCAPSVDTMVITFTDVPASEANAGVDQELCDVTQTRLDATSVGVGSGIWTQISGAATTITAPTNPKSLVNGLAPGTYEFQWSTNNNSSGCSFTDVVEIVVLEQPANANAGSDQIVPQFSTIILGAVPTTVGEGTWTQVSGPTTANFVDINNPTTSISGTTIGTYVFTWTVTNGICAETADNVTIIVNGIADLELSKSVSPASANIGDTVTFTISIFNNAVNSSTAATGVSITDLVPSGYSFVLGTATNNAVYNSGNLSLIWNNLTVPLGATLDLEFQATVNTSGNYTNTAEIIASDQSDPDSSINNNSALEDDQDTATITLLTADISLVKSVSPSQVSIGETVTFTIAINNLGPDSATGISVVDNVPLGYTITGINNGGLLNNNAITWSGITVNAAATAEVTFTAMVNKPTGALNEYVNKAQITASDVFDPDSSPNNDDGDQSEDDESNTSITLENADLEISKSSSTNSGNIGDILTFTVAVFNNDAVENGDATGVTIVDNLPNGFTLVGGSVSNGGNYNFGNNTVTWSNLAIANGATTNLSYQVTVNGNGNYTNTAQVTASDLNDPDSTPNNDDGDQSEDDEDNSIFTLETADLSLTKGISASSSATPNIGDTVTFELTVTNDGPDAAENVVVMDLIPSGYTIGAINNGGSSGGNFITWDILTVAPGVANAVVVSFDAIVNQTGNYKNTAEILFSDQFDPDSEPGNDNGLQSEDDEASFTVDPQQVDLSLSKSVDNNRPNVGSVVTFTLTLTNRGVDTATGVAVEDILPSGYTLVTVNSGTVTGNTASWINQTVAANNGTLQLTYTATVNAPTNTIGEYDNAAQITAADQFDADSTPNNDDGDQSEDDEDGITTIPQVADISLAKTANTNTPNVGDTVIFTLTLTNSGPSVATNIAVQDILPAGFTLLSAPGGTVTGNTADWSNLTVAANNGELMLTYSATVNAPTGTVGEYLNQAQITASDQYDPDSTVNNNDPNEDDQDALEIVPNSGDLSLRKTVVDNDITPIVGSEITFEIIVFNDGPNNATGVVVEDLLPSGYDFVLYSSTAGLYNETTGIWTVGNVTSGGSETLLIDVLVNTSGIYENIAEVTASDVFDLDSTPNNNILAEDDQANATVTPMQVVDVSLDKSVNNATPDVNTNITFTIDVTNDGPSPATNLIVTDQLPTGFTYVSDDSGAAYNAGTGIWTIGSLAKDATVSLNIIVSVNTTGNYTNVAEVTGMDQTDVDSTPNNTILAEDDQDQVVVTPRKLVDVSVTKVASTLTPAVGSQIDFTIAVTNDGPSDATTVVVTDLLNSGYTFISAVPSVGTYQPLNGSWTVGNLPTGITQNLVISATVLAEGIYTNTAELTDLTEFDIDSEPANNDATEDDQETINPVPAVVSNLSLTKTVDNATPLVGENVEFTLDLFNAGPNDARGVVVMDQLPSGYTYVSHTATAGSYNRNSGLWTINGNLFNSTTETLNIIARVNPTGNYLNVAQITASPNSDPNSTPNNNILAEDDQDEQNTVPIPLADLSLTKTVDNQFPDVADTVIFTLTLANNGPSAATGIVVTDILESGYNYQSDTSGGAYNAATGLWNVGTLASGTSIALNVTVGINTTGNYNNIAQVTSVNELDPDSTPNNNILAEDDQAEQNTLPRVITDISLVKTVDNLSPSVGDQIVFSIAVTNSGPSDATGVIIEDILASGYTFESAIATAGTYDESIGSWDINTIANGVTETLEITVTVLPNGEYSNIAELIALDTFDPDSSPDNNLNSEDDQDTVSPIPTGLADLSLTKVVDNIAPNVGDIIEFTLNITNSGDSAATGVVVTDLLPVGYTYVSHLTTIGIYNRNTGAWTTNGTIPNGTTETLIILARVNAPSGVANEYLNIAEITASNQSDPDSDTNSDFNTDDFADGIDDDDEASAFVVPQVTDIAISKVVSNTTPSIGGEVIFTITAANISTMEATNVGVEEILPTGYQFISATATNGVYDAFEGFWAIPVIAAESSEILTLTVRILEPDDYVNTASLSYLDQIDLNMDNDSAQAFVTPTCLHVFNEFSPNGDMVNDFFKIECISRYPNNTLKVYNRWGNIVFEQQGYNNTWEGISNGRATINEGKQLPVGTYYYILDLGDGSKPIQDWLYINR